MQEKRRPKKTNEIIKKNKDKSGEDHPNIFGALQSTMVDTLRSFSRGTDKVADIIIDSGEEETAISAKAKKIKGEIVSTAREIGATFKKNLKGIGPEDILHDTSYTIGRFSKIAKDRCTEFLDVLIY